MIKLYDENGSYHLINPDDISRISEANISSKWHGIRAYIRMKDGSEIGVTESINDIERMINEITIR